MRLVRWLRSLTSPSVSRPPRACLRVEALEERAVPSASHDILYVGDSGDNSVKKFDATTGAYLGTLVPPGGGGLDGPRGMIFQNPGKLLVVNQNVDQSFNGAILRYNSRTGAPEKDVVSSSDPNGTFAPRGMVLRDGVVYVADVEGATTPGGQVEEFDLHSGRLLGTLTPAHFSGQFNPRGVVFGPDGGLYVSAFDTTNPLVGYVFRFDVETGASTIVAANNGDGIDQPGETRDLHRPEGLVFGPDGALYVTSFRANAADTDKVLVFNASSGALKDEINLDQAGQPRAFGQAIEFGPDGKLFVPISGTGPDTGSIRRYDVATHAFTVFVAPSAQGGPLGSPWYVTFGQTDPATLSYDGERDTGRGEEGDRHADVATTATDHAYADLGAAPAQTALAADVINSLLSATKHHDLDALASFGQ